MSGISNEELVEKAVITTDSIAASGKLNPAQSNKFIDYVVQETMLTENARIVRFRNEQLDIDKIGIGTRVAMPKAEAVDPGLRRGINASKITLTPSEIMTPFEISDTFRDVNIEGDDVEDHIIRMMATQKANDTEEMFITGDKLKPAILEADYRGAGSSAQYISDNFLGLQDGWQKIADGGHQVDAAGKTVGLSIFSEAIRNMPTKFRRRRQDLRFYMSPDLHQIYLEKISTRATSLGDSASGGGGHKPYGIPIVEVPLWNFLPPVVEHVTLTGTTPVSLKYAPVQDVVVLPETLGSTPTTPFVEGGGNDYNLDAAAGTIARDAAGSIGDGDTVKVWYKSNPQIILTHRNNFIVGIGRDVRIEKDRDIFKGVNQYAITTKVALNFEEDDAIVKVRNLGVDV